MKSFFTCEKYKNNEQHLKRKFIIQFGYIKVGLLIFFSIISVIYQTLLFFKDETKRKMEQTLLNKFPLRIIYDGLITSLFGFISFIFVWWSRGMHYSLSLKIFSIIFTLLFVFIIAQEASGFNRFMEKSNILKGTSIYNKMNNINPKAEKMLENNGDPFVLNSAYFLFFLMISISIFIIIKMIKYMICAHNLLPQYNICNINIIFNTKMGNKYLLFILELLIMISLNMIPPMFISPILRYQTEEKKINFTIILIFLIVVGLHIMLQYLGML